MTERRHGLLRSFILGFLSLVILGLGGAGLFVLWSFRQAPEKRAEQRPPRQVKALKVVPRTLSFPVHSYGTVRPRRRVVIYSELSGLVTAVHPDLRAGLIIDQGEDLFRIDKRRYEIQLARLSANQDLLTASLAALEREQLNLRQLRDHSAALVKVAEAEVTRLENLVQRNVGTVSALDGARRVALTQRTALINADGQLALLPARRKELEARFAGLKAELEQARLDLEKTRVVSPFRAKVESTSIEVGSFLQPGQPALVLVDQGALELLVSLSKDDLRWLDPAAVALGNGYDQDRAAAEPGQVTVSWSQGPRAVSWAGRLGRLESVDPGSRTFEYVVEIPNPMADFDPRRDVPLTVGMFCEASLPGRSVDGVFVLPRELIEQGRIMVVRDGRLDFNAVEILRYLPEGVLARGLSSEALVISSRVPYPTRGMPVRVVVEDEAAR